MIKKKLLQNSPWAIAYTIAVLGLTGMPSPVSARLKTEIVEQVGNIQGTVLDSNGDPIVGATIRVAGTKIATVSDLDGNFTLQTNKGVKLEVSYIGYQKQIVTATEHIVVRLKDDARVLSDVVVVGYGTMRKKISLVRLCKLIQVKLQTKIQIVYKIFCVELLAYK